MIKYNPVLMCVLPVYVYFFINSLNLQEMCEKFRKRLRWKKREIPEADSSHERHSMVSRKEHMDG